MAKSCLWKPTKGTQAFNKIKASTSYEKAWRIIGIASNDDFIAKYKKSLSFDAEGFPTLESLLDNKYIQKELGISNVAKIKNIDFPPMEDTIQNYQNLLMQALTFNRENTDKPFAAIVDYFDDKIGIKIVENTPANLDTFKRQYATYILNQRLAEILKPLGITPEMLSDIETKAGRAGSTQFGVALGLAKSANVLIKIANNMEGVEALSEEFSHVIIDSLYDHPLVQRALNSLTNGEVLENILGDEFSDLLEFYDGNLSLIAEEALGQILQSKLNEEVQKSLDKEFKSKIDDKLDNSTKNIFTRIINYIKSLFKNMSLDDSTNAIREANTIMQTLSEQLLSSKIKINKTNTRNRSVLFNSLSERIDRNIEVLKQAIKTETKRSILTHEDPKVTRNKINNLDRYIKDRNKSALGVMMYAHKSLRMLQNAQDKLNSFDLLNTKEQLSTLRTTKTIIQSLGTFMDEFVGILNNEGREDDNLFEGEFELRVKGKTVKVEAKQLLNDMSGLINQIGKQYTDTAMPIFVQFLKDSLGDDLVELLLKHNGNKKGLEELIKHSAHDISFLDLWVDAMRDSSNPILQAYDKVVKNANDKARLNAIDNFKEIQELRRQAEEMGITNFDFMFEVDALGNKSGNYVNPNYNLAEYNRQYALLEKRLADKYGDNPTGKDREDRNKEKQAWLKENSTPVTGFKRIPKSSKFPARKLSSDEMKVLKSFLDYKDKLDKKYPENKVSRYKAIQIRKNGVQRMLDGGINPVTIYKNWIENIKATYLESSDDDTIFGEATSGLTNFDGTEYMRLPMFYNTRLSNPEELSTDVFGSLYAYAAAANKYEQLEKIVTPLEVGRTLIKENMTVTETHGQKVIRERINKAGQKFEKDAIMSSESNIIKKLDEFMETQVYQRYLKDEGTFEIFGAKVKTSKVTSEILKLGSIAQLGLNGLANMANATTGAAMINIEANTGQFFKRKELLEADAEYFKLLKDFIPELYARDKSSKLALFDEMFDVRQNFGASKHHMEYNNLLTRMFGKNLAFIGQEAGDHWLYNRVAIAMVKHIKVKYKGEETTLWDVLEIKEHPGTQIKKMYIPEGVVDLQGNGFDEKRIGDISRKIAAINHKLFGIYNEDDMSAANRTSIGRIIMQYRKWMKPQFNARFEAKRTDLDLGEEVEGYYRTSYRLAKEIMSELKRGEFQYVLWKDNLSDLEKYNLKRTLTEVVQFAAVYFLVSFVLAGGPPDRNDKKYKGISGDALYALDYAKYLKDKANAPYPIKLIRYVGNRLYHELGNLVPSYTMANEMRKTADNPAAIMGVIGDCSTFVGAILSPSQWNDELQSGTYKGHSRLYKRTMNLPFAPFAYKRQFDRMINGLDKAMQFYTNPDIN